MVQRNSGYERKPFDLYETPAWVTESLLFYIPKRIQRILEPAAGKGAMVKVLRENHFGVLATDINEYAQMNICGKDFLSQDASISDWPEAIITNPPYNKASEFVRKSVQLMMRRNGFVAMLLPENFDCAKGRMDLFGYCPVYSGKVVLTRRIKWFDGEGSPSSNHAWFLWDALSDLSGPKIHYVY
jgi:hypothetical protein